MSSGLGLAVALGLAACAGTPQWSKQGVTPNAAAADYADCRSQAQALTKRDSDIDADILASRGRDWAQTNTISTREALFPSDRGTQSSDYVQSCMIGKGYAPGE
jgi:hypothetical protein